LREPDVRDREMMSDPTTWPNWPLLPVKRYEDNDIECAVIRAVQGQMTWVVCVSFWGLVDKSETLEGAKVLKYESLDKLLADGWVVD